jgi:hypothetical protein
VLVNTFPAVPGEVNPVPPLDAANVPATVIAPVVAVLGVNPIDAKDIEETASVGKAILELTQEVPLLVKTFPFAPGAVNPVPPFAAGNAVPEYARDNVPAPVTGLPVTVNKAGAVNPTEVTVPAEAGTEISSTTQICTSFASVNLNLYDVPGTSQTFASPLESKMIGLAFDVVPVESV